MLDTFLKFHNKYVIHFIGIGGIGMSAIAQIMHNLGCKIQGSDLAHTPLTSKLEKLGIKIFFNHKPENITNATYIVASAAITDDNPEIIHAKKRNIPIIKRSEILAELMRNNISISVAGSHGKTTTTGLIGNLFMKANLDPTIINGGIINNLSANAYLGKGDHLIVEADESDGTFIRLPSTIGIVTNIDPEHMDYYKNFDELFSAFKLFIENLPFYGFAILCIDNANVRKLSEEINQKNIITYGIESRDANVIGFNIRSNLHSSIFDVKDDSGKLLIKDVAIPILGKHNILNVLATIALGLEFNLGVNNIKKGLENFHGIKRRFTKIKEFNGIEIIDDYAHHPVEIENTLLTAQSIANKKGGKVIAIFQPHRYSRLQNLFNEFTYCFKDADSIYITDVFSAGEEEIDGINGPTLANAISQIGKKSSFIKEYSEILNIVKSSSKGDIILLMGAGNISQWGKWLTKKLDEEIK